jgi:N-formylglutamate amidohydrolase
MTADARTIALEQTIREASILDEERSPSLVKQPALAYELFDVDPVRSAVVLTSPHSGRDYADELVASARLGLATLRQSEDAFVDDLFALAPRHGMPLLAARFPRVFIDVNREPYELDPGMFAAPLPGYVNTTSPRVAAGLGTIPRIVATGEEIYATPLDFAEASQRLREYYFPFHAALQGLLRRTYRTFAGYLLVDCHSMPSVAASFEADAGLRRADFVLGDCFGTACAPAITEFVEAFLRARGYSVRRNIPYAGGHITRANGKPSEGRHAIQIEVNRALYLDERRVEPHSGFARLAAHLGELVAALGELDRAVLAPLIRPR